MTKVKCSVCGQTLCKANLMYGKVEIKCPRCKRITLIESKIKSRESTDK
uniref:DNA-directed RNA polymerase n=1 Tax=Siphoviridae sp. ctNs77 TaxID=2825473 RepID=A0A8S5QHN6_9CAUD|nr:MAG TPA: DNA-directed RNA polymerase [Siphoviridae sp. ctNs77]